MAWWETVDWSDPINRDCSLNDGVVEWFLPNPLNFGGTVLHGLTSRANGTLTNGPTWVPDQYGNGISFDASNDYIGCGTNFPNLNSSLTLELVVRFKSLAGYNMLITKTNSNISAPWDWYTVGGGGLSRFIAGGSALDGTTQVTVGPVYQLVCTYDGATLKQYMNGAANGSAAASTPATNGTQEVKIGTRDDLFAYANIVVYSARILSRPIGADEARESYRQWQRGWPDMLSQDSPSMPYSMQAAGGVTAKIPYHHLFGSCL